jgi:hypothetical protein
MKPRPFFAKKSPWGRFPCGPSDWDDPQPSGADNIYACLDYAASLAEEQITTIDMLENAV